MNRKILIKVAAPTVLIGMLLFGACLASGWYVNRLQRNLSKILVHNVASLRAAEQLEISARKLRFHCFLYLIDPEPPLLREIEEDHRLFEGWLAQAKEAAVTEKEHLLTARIGKGFQQYLREFERVRRRVEKEGPGNDPSALAAAHPIRHFVEPCQEYLRVNEEMMGQTAEESAAVSRRLNTTMIFLGLGGPLGGLLAGYGIARGLSRSLHRLSVHVHGMAQQLDQDVVAVKLSPDGDLEHLDRQLQLVVGRVTEVTERLQRQQQDMLRAQQLAAVGQLAASVAHEVRNPLTSIKMLVDASLRPHRPKPFTEDNLRVVHAEVQRLEQTVQDFLDFARPPALHRCRADVREVVRQAVELVQARARQQTVQIDIRVPEQPLVAELDRGQLCNVLVNLLINALDAMPTGGLIIVQLEHAARQGLRLTVSDNGPGICPNISSKLFTPFTSGKPTGSGLGLSICKRIIEEHGGNIVGGNRSQGGAFFTVSLPMPNAEPSMPAIDRTGVESPVLT